MPIGVCQFIFKKNGENDVLKNAAEANHNDSFKNFGMEEWLCLLYENECELFFSPATSHPADKILKTTISKIFSPGKTVLKNQYLIGRPAAARFLQIACGAAGSHYGKPLLEILHDAYLRAGEGGFIGPIFHRLFQRGIWLHEKARQETDFFRFAVTPETVIGELAGKILGSITPATIHVFGNHPIFKTVLQELYQAGCRKFVFSGNSQEIDEELVYQLGGVLQTADTFKELPAEADILLAAPSQTPALSEQYLQKREKARRKFPLVIFDYTSNHLDYKRLKKISNFYIYSEKDIEKVIEFNTAERRGSARQIDHWVQAEIETFYEWYTSEDRHLFAGIVGATPQMQHIFEMISRIARTDITVLIDGESGTGKELVAKAIHELSNRSDKPFKVINCGAIPENLLESELFGHERGAFTGAVAQKVGLFETAHSGTVFLDEIAELPPPLQVKLLRFLQEGEIKRVGSNETIRLNVRVLAATNKNLAQMVEAGLFRSDLFYRLNVIQLTIPPLRQRPADIPLLIKFFIKKYAAKLHKDVSGITPEAQQTLCAYFWPGNIRELENTIERSVALAFGKIISLYDLPPNLQHAPESAATNHSPKGERLTLKELEKKHILETLEACDWDYDQACEQLAIGRTTLWRKLKEYNLEN